MEILAKKMVAAILLTLGVSGGSLQAQDWVTWSSTYTHSPTTGQRVDQFSLPEVPLGPAPEAVQTSGYRNTRSTLQVGSSADNYHRVEQWGGQVTPYEHWRFPYRPYGVPYGAWGPQLPAVLGQFQTPYGFPGYGFVSPGVFPQQTPTQGTVTVPAFPGTGQGGGTQGGGTGVPPPGIGVPFQGRGNGAFRGIPIQPQYRSQPWFDGFYPDAPPLDPRTDEQFFWKPQRTPQSNEP